MQHSFRNCLGLAKLYIKLTRDEIFEEHRCFLSSEAEKSPSSHCRKQNAPSVWMEQLKWMSGITAYKRAIQTSQKTGGKMDFLPWFARVRAGWFLCVVELYKCDFCPLCHTHTQRSKKRSTLSSSQEIFSGDLWSPVDINLK